MKLIKTHKTRSILGLPPVDVERWDLGEGYNISVYVEKESCTMGIHSPRGNITYEVARLLGIDTKPEKITLKPPAEDSELFLILGIDCVTLVYTKPENYKELLEKIELIINEHFKK